MEILIQKSLLDQLFLLKSLKSNLEFTYQQLFDRVSVFKSSRNVQTLKFTWRSSFPTYLHWVNLFVLKFFPKIAFGPGGCSNFPKRLKIYQITIYIGLKVWSENCFFTRFSAWNVKRILKFFKITALLGSRGIFKSSKIRQTLTLSFLIYLNWGIGTNFFVLKFYLKIDFEPGFLLIS